MRPGIECLHQRSARSRGGDRCSTRCRDRRSGAVARRHDQAAAGLHDRSRRPRAERACDGARPRWHAVRRLDRCRTGSRRNVSGSRSEGRGGRSGRGVGLARARRRSLPWRVALCFGDRSHPAFRRHRAAPRRSAEARGRHRQAAGRSAPRPQVHRVRSRRQALHQRRRAMQHLRARSRPLRGDRADESRWLGARSLRERRAQLGRLRLGSADERPVVHDQRPRLAR